MKQKILILILALIAIGTNFLSADLANTPRLGQEIAPEEIAAWDISIYPDGEGLPKGEGSVYEGENIYKAKCIVCHGKYGLGHSADQLAGAEMSLTSEYPEKTIGSYWPYATTLFDFVRRSMPMAAPGSLIDDEVYALTAYLLYLNNLIGKDDKMNDSTLPKVEMPNRDGFINIYEIETAHQ
jgi:cytochrome c